MITVEKVLEKNVERGTEVAKDNEELLKTGSVREVKKPIWPWILAIIAALVGGYLLLRPKKGSGTNNAGISG